MMNFKRTYVPANGFTKLCKIGEGSLKKLEFGIIELTYDQEILFDTEEMETAFIILGGQASFSFDDIEYKMVGKRRTVFEGKAYAVYIPRRKKVKIHSPWNVKIAVCQTMCDEDTSPALVTPADISRSTLGKPTWKRDTDFVISDTTPSKRLYVGEAFVHPGNWAGFPPHKHDTDAMPAEGVAEEFYFYLFDPEQGFGIQRTYAKEEFDEAYVIENNTLVEFPKGYHTTVGAPGYNFYFLWAMAGDHKGFYRSSDPKHAWVSSVENLLSKNGI
jgi:5-deoxy-glucuronate isomerase